MFKVSYTGTLGKLATLPGGHVLMDQICFSYFCQRLSYDHFYHIILNSDNQFQEKIFKVCLSVISHAPWRPCFLLDQISFSLLSEGHQITISAKSFSILTTGSRRSCLKFLT